MLSTVIRWILLIPAVGLTTSLILKIFLPKPLIAERLGGRQFGNHLRSFITVLAYFLYGFFPVAVGGWIAPSYKIIVGILLALFSVVEALRRSYIFSHFTKSAYSNAAATIIGSVIAATNF